MQLEIEYLKKEDLKPYANNAKLHPKEQIEQIKKSIEEFGFNDPIAVYRDNEIIEGHGRLLAAMEMEGVDAVPVVRLDNLSDEQCKAYRLIHNQLTMNSGWDFDVLNVELDEIQDIDMEDFDFSLHTLDFMGFDEAEQDDHSKRMNSKIVTVVIGSAKFEMPDPDHKIYEATRKIDELKATEVLSKLLLDGGLA